MKLYQPIHLDCASQIQKYVKEFVSANEKIFKVWSFHMPMPPEIRSTLDKELAARQISKSEAFVMFRRDNTDIHYRTCHVDGGANFGVLKSSVVIPISGCEGTQMLWYNGDYIIEETISPSNVKYNHINWRTPPDLIESVEIIDTPMLCRVNIPHTAISNGLEHRITLTFRFEADESFDELCEKFK